MRNRNWQKVELATVSEFISRGKSPEYVSRSEIKIINQKCIYWEGLKLENVKYLNHKVKLQDKFTLKKGDLLINSTGTGTLGRATIFDQEGVFTIDSHITLFRPIKDFNSNYLKYYLRTEQGQKELYQKCVSGSTNQIELSKSKFEKLNISLPFLDGKPDLEAQNKIVSFIEKSEKLKEKSEKSERLLNEYIESVFNEMFLNKEFNKVNLDHKELYKDIFAGGDVQKVNFSKIKTEKFKFPIFTNGEKNNGLYGYTDTPRVSKESVTISARGTIGYCEIRKEPFYPAIRLIVLTPNEKVLNINFLKYAIDTLKFNLDGTSIPQLTIPMLGNPKYKIPLPPIELQNKFSLIVKKVEEIKKRQRTEINNAEELFNSLMQKAFKRELL